jgi:hypothetical protein
MIDRFYGFGLVVYHLFRYNRKITPTYSHLDIAQGIRPNLDEAEIPPLFQSIITACWDNSITEFDKLGNNIYIISYDVAM